jgi:hypothetical protein
MNGNLLRVVALYCQRTGMPESTFGRTVANDPRLVSDMRAGRTLRPTTARKVREFMGVAL